MWFTRVSLHNPVLATMVMLALVVLGSFSLQRLQVDQFPNIDFPVVVVITDYPGASPEVVEVEVTRKIEEGINGIAGINALTSRSYEGQSVVVVEFALYVNGRKAAEDVREKVASVRPTLRAEVMENVRGVGSVSLVGGTRREINLYLNPEAMESLGVTPEQVVTAVRGENQAQPVGTLRSLAQERVVQIDARMQRPEDFGRIIVARKNGATVRLEQVARVADGAQEIDSLALYNSQRTLLLTVQKSQDENTIQVIDGLNAALRRTFAG